MEVGTSQDATPDRQIAQLRVPPHSVEGESSVLGGLLLDNIPDVMLVTRAAGRRAAARAAEADQEAAAEAAEIAATEAASSDVPAPAQ